MKTLKRTIAIICTLITLFSFFSLFAGAASISSNKHTATGVNASQSVYITSNNGWNTELFGNTYRTQVQIKLGSAYYEYFQYNLSTGRYAKVKVTIYKKTNNKWSQYSQGTYNCNNKGYISSGSSAKTFVLPGKNVQYKISFSPIVSEPVTSMIGYSRPANLNNMTVSITTYGQITSVS